MISKNQMLRGLLKKRIVQIIFIRLPRIQNLVFPKILILLRLVQTFSSLKTINLKNLAFLMQLSFNKNTAQNYDLLIKQVMVPLLNIINHFSKY